MFVDSGGVALYVEVTGPEDGTPVVLLHGWPDTGRLWEHQVEALSAAGYRVIVPDQRGHGRSGKPEAVDDYNMMHLVADVGTILDHLGIARAHLVGHDWGAAVAWVTASLAPDRIEHLAVLSVGHPTASAQGGLRQREKAWYQLLFLFEGVAETWLTQDGWANFHRWAGHPKADEVIAEVETSGSLTTGLNWYRANLHPRRLIEPPPALPPIAAPTLGIWSSGDVALVEETMVASAPYVTGTWRYQRLDGLGHWMQLEAPDEVNRLLLEWLAPDGG